ncbi:putative defense protein Hdd11-like isoform X2 [Dermacentor albipictus]|uniref:putative defense protein Hdd11-like isoform X2 n=1 Tax=Dermacentor albipictus TaxID=60249 RepID=UPI0038FCFCDA
MAPTRISSISGMSLRHLFFLVVLGRGAVCYPNGAPPTACGDMTPNHGFTASTDKGNLTLTATPHDKRSAKVTLEGTFKGFLIKAVDSNGMVVGNFTPDMPAIAKGIECDGHHNSAITHTSRVEKSSVPVTWTASDDYKGGDVIFRATVVRSKADYYLKLESSALKIEGPSPSDRNKSDKKEEGPGSSPTSRSTSHTAWLVAPVLGCVILSVRHRCLAYL